MENLLPQNVESVNYQLLAIMLLKQPNGKLGVAVYHSQLWTITSETVDPIDWPLPPTRHRAVLTELHVLHCGVRGA